MEQTVENRSNLRKPSLYVNFTTTKPAKSSLGSNLGLRGETEDSNHPIHGTDVITE